MIEKGTRFGMLTVIMLSGRNKHRDAKYYCKCDCGRKITVYSGNLTSGRTKTCGHFSHEQPRMQNGRFLPYGSQN